MWKCPQCETVNKNDKCIICGESNPYFPKVTLPFQEGSSRIKSTMRSYGDDNFGMGKITYPTGQVQQDDLMQPDNSGYGEGTVPEWTETSVNVPYEAPARSYIEQTIPIDNLYGEAVTEPENAEIPKKKSKTKKWIIGILIALVVLAAGTVGFLEIQRSRAKSALNDGNYEKAKSIYSGIGFYRDSASMVNECDYMKAIDMLESGEPEKAEKIFEELGHYKDSSLKILDCELALAEEYLEEGDKEKAFECLEELVEKEYEGSDIKMEYLIEEFYEDAVRKYHEGDYDIAKDIFELHKDGCLLLGETANPAYNKYMTLIEVHLGLCDDISEIYDLIDFEDTKDILLSDEYIFDFLTGEWVDSLNNVIEFTPNSSGGITCSCSLPYEDGSYYKIEDGVQYYGDDGREGWTKAMRYEIVHENKITVYCYSNGSTYIMYRQ